MGIRALSTAATGMEAFQFNLDNIANNLANAGTTAFKKTRVNFEDLYYQHLRLPGAQDLQGQTTPTGVAIGLGTRVASTGVDHRQGSLTETGGQLDLAIAGDGLFQVQDGDQTLYTRSGAFSINADGQVVLTSADRGRLLEPPMTIPQDATEISISSDGIVSVLTPGATTLQEVGQLELARFVNPQGLIQKGENLYAESNASGPPLIGSPGTEGRGAIRQGFLESSNVEPVRELVNLIKTQRHVELNSQVVQAADQTLQLLASLRRF